MHRKECSRLWQSTVPISSFAFLFLYFTGLLQGVLSGVVGDKHPNMARGARANEERTPSTCAGGLSQGGKCI